MKAIPKNIRDLIKEIKKRWFRKVVRMGLSLVILTFLLFVFIYLALVLFFDISILAQSILALSMLLLLIFEISWSVVRPAVKGINAEKIALYIEEKNPQLEDRLNSAVEIGHLSIVPEKNILIEKLLDDAFLKMKSVPLTTILNRKKEKLLSYGTVGALFLFLLFSALFRTELKEVISDIHFSLDPKTHIGQNLVHISPGDIQVEKGESLEILAELKKETENDFIIHYKSGKTMWQNSLMEPGLDKKTFLYQLLDIQEPGHYYIEHNSFRSPEFAISIYEFPSVLQIDLKYTYPKYTQLPAKHEENTGNIRGLQGSEVTLSVTTSGSAKSGEIAFNNGSTIKLASQGDGLFQGQFTIQDPGTYHIKLTDQENKNNKFPQEYQIIAVKDELPLITITDPQRNIRVNAVEEVLLAVSVSDDYGINSSNVIYSVNGLDEKSINLLEKNIKGKKETSSSHIFYLEDFELEPGDVISYYIEANDYLHKDPALTDMYFIEVTPFDADYRQANNQGGGAAGMNAGGSQTVLNQQTIINATWNLIRKRNHMSNTEFKQASQSLEQAQTNLKNNIKERIQSTAFALEMVTDDENKAIVELLRQAVEQMEAAVKKLHDRKFREALTPERRALNYLLKADAKNKEKMVQRGQMAAAGGAGSSQMEERMTELMDLELDISKDKYEIQQQNAQQQNQEMDKAMQKLKELAQKQERLTRDSRETLRQETPERRELDRLKRDQERLRQETENLAQQIRNMSRNNEQISRQLQERIDKITENMRESEQEMNSGNMQKSMSKQRQAMNELNRLQQSLGSNLTDNAREMLDQFVEDFKELKQKERQHAQEIQNFSREIENNQGEIKDFEKLKELTEKRQELIDELNDLESQALAVEEQSQQQNPTLSTQLKNIQNRIQREDIERNMTISKAFVEKGWLHYAKIVEDEIKKGFDGVENEIDKLKAGIPLTEEENLNRTLEDTREMLQRFQDAFAQVHNNQPDENEPGQLQEQKKNQGQQEAQNQDGQNTSKNNRNRHNEKQMNRLLEQTREMLERIERDFQDNGSIQDAAESARRSYTPRIRGELLGENAREYFDKKIYDPLSQLEIHLLKRLDEIESIKKLYSMRKEDVPQEYRKMVNKYFESISK